jgi:hypothetical protein
MVIVIAAGDNTEDGGVFSLMLVLTQRDHIKAQ